MSHRGGPPGFVVVGTEESATGDGGAAAAATAAATTLTWPDYAGNNMFNSLGNLLLNPACGLLFVDFATGDTLQLCGRAAVDFEERSLPGAQRTVRFVVERWRHARSALPIEPAPLLEASPHNPRSSVAQRTQQEMVTCTGVTQDAAGIKTFEFQAPPSMLRRHEAGEACFLPGQHASFDFETSSGETLNRTWTISCHPGHTAATGRFTISVKRKPGGAVSPVLHDALRAGMQVGSSPSAVDAGQWRIGVRALRASLLRGVLSVRCCL